MIGGFNLSGIFVARNCFPTLKGRQIDTLLPLAPPNPLSDSFASKKLLLWMTLPLLLLGLNRWIGHSPDSQAAPWCTIRTLSQKEHCIAHQNQGSFQPFSDHIWHLGNFLLIKQKVGLIFHPTWICILVKIIQINQKMINPFFTFVEIVYLMFNCEL